MAPNFLPHPHRGSVVEHLTQRAHLRGRDDPAVEGRDVDARLDARVVALGGPEALRQKKRALPADVAQACGHTGYAKCRALLWASMTDEARGVARGGLRTLSVRGGETRYAMGLEAHAEGAATLYLLDADLSRGVEDATLMQVAEVYAG